MRAGSRARRVRLGPRPGPRPPRTWPRSQRERRTPPIEATRAERAEAEADVGVGVGVGLPTREPARTIKRKTTTNRVPACGARIPLDPERPPPRGRPEACALIGRSRRWTFVHFVAPRAAPCDVGPNPGLPSRSPARRSQLACRRGISPANRRAGSLVTWKTHNSVLWITENPVRIPNGKRAPVR